MSHEDGLLQQLVVALVKTQPLIVVGQSELETDGSIGDGELAHWARHEVQDDPKPSVEGHEIHIRAQERDELPLELWDEGGDGSLLAWKRDLQNRCQA